MHTHIDGEERLAMDATLQMAGAERDMLVRCGFSREEIAALVFLWQWYQTGGSDRVQIVRHLEFLKLLVLHRKLAL